MTVKPGDVVKVNYRDCPHPGGAACFTGIVVEVTYSEFFSVMTTEEKIRIVSLRDDKVEIIIAEMEN